MQNGGLDKQTPLYYVELTKEFAMKTYKVGGCVRDVVMIVNPKDFDYVVVGSSEEEMIKSGYSKVGADFPVFLHPETREEYALARTEKKTGNGYNGFSCEVENVSLLDDLKRRDFSINAMAIDDNIQYYDQDKLMSNIIDPFGGLKDLKNKVLRHVNAESFKEDPLRVLRAARFLARWPEFTVAKETTELCKNIVESGELNHLTEERVWTETRKALNEKVPSRFFIFLEMIGALKIIYPEISALRNVPQPFNWHPEGDCFEHTMQVTDAMARHVNGSRFEQFKDLFVFAALTHDLGKATTKPEILPSHHGHEDRGFWIVQNLCKRLKIGNDFRDHAALVAKYHTHIHNFMILNPKTVVNMFNDLNIRKNEFILFLLPMVAEADKEGRGSFYRDVPYPQKDIAINVFGHLSLVKLSNFFSVEEIKNLSVPKIKDFLFKKSIEVVKNERE